MIARPEILVLLVVFGAIQVLAIDRQPYDYVRPRLSYLKDSMSVDLFSTRWVSSIVQRMPFNPEGIKETLRAIYRDATQEDLSETERWKLVSTKYMALTSSLDAANALMGELIQLADTTDESRCTFDQIKHILAAVDSLFGLVWRVNDRKRSELLLPDAPKPLTSFSNIYHYIRFYLAVYATLCAYKIVPEFEKYLKADRKPERTIDSIMHHSSKPWLGLQHTLELDEIYLNRAANLEDLATVPVDWIYGMYPEQLRLRIPMGVKIRDSTKAIRDNCLELVNLSQTSVGAFEVVSLVSPLMSGHVLNEDIAANRKITFLKLREYNRLCYAWLSVDASKFSSMPGFARRPTEHASSSSKAGLKGLFSDKH